MNRLPVLLLIILALLVVTGCSKPPFEVLMKTDSLMRYSHPDTKKSRNAVYQEAKAQCAYSQSTAVHGKTFCDQDICETSYFCE